MKKKSPPTTQNGGLQYHGLPLPSVVLWFCAQTQLMRRKFIISFSERIHSLRKQSKFIIKKKWVKQNKTRVLSFPLRKALARVRLSRESCSWTDFTLMLLAQYTHFLSFLAHTCNKFHWIIWIYKAPLQTTFLEVKKKTKGIRKN